MAQVEMLTERVADSPFAAVSLLGQVPEVKWHLRQGLSALYRLAAGRGREDLIFTHFSARIPGEEHHFLITPYGSGCSTRLPPHTWSTWT